ncbi:MAG: MotA/TolQ/ExbB proton channel family protein [Planctomycetota bacterium]
MLDPRSERRQWLLYAILGGLLLSVAWTFASWPISPVWAQEAKPSSDAKLEANMEAEAEADTFRGPEAKPVGDPGSKGTADEAADDLVRRNEDQGINFFALLVRGGWFMIPISLLSLLVATIVIERALSLRRGRVLPGALVNQLGEMGGRQNAFDPRAAYRVCQQYPSAAANVVRAMLLKVGRPHGEVEHTVAESSEREAERLYANVRWLNLAAGVAPLLGLLGTVWGMIDAFHRTTILAPGQNKAEELATGIYVALVTTFGGLMIAIPAAIFAHLFEGRIQKLFHEIDEMLFNLLPQIERFEGRMRFGQPAEEESKSSSPPEPPRVVGSSSRR